MKAQKKHNIIIIIVIALFIYNTTFTKAYSEEVIINKTNNKTENIQDPSTEQERHWLLPDFAMFQTAGYIGYVVGGIGYDFFNSKLDIIFNFGYVPKRIGGKAIKAFAIKNNYYPVKFSITANMEITPIYIGITSLFALHKNLYWTSSTDCPKDEFYYPPTGVHFALNIGTQIIIAKNNSFFAELSMLDTYAKAYFHDDPEHLKFNECVTMAFGYKYIF